MGINPRVVVKYLLLIFVVCTVTLGVLVKVQKTPDPFGDGRLVCLPLPPPLERQIALPMLTPGPPRIKRLENPAAPIQVASASIEIFEPEPHNESLLQLRQADQSEWGLSRMQNDSMVLASLIQPKLVNPVPIVTPTPVPTPAEIVPNLYLPEGALNEEGAQMTLIKNELHAYKDPDVKSEAAPFVMKEGEQVRPLTRLRNEKEFDWIKIERDGKQWWTQAEYFIRVDPRNKVAGNLPVGEEAVDKDSALPPKYAPGDMVAVSRQHILDDREIKLRKEVAEALSRMIDAAAKKGLKIRIFSGYRDFEHQKRLYLEAIEKKGPKQNGTAVPGYSEHQLGTTVDISNADKSYVLSARFGETPEGRWLHENAEKYGFRNSYTMENIDESGYKAEPWHWRYIGTPNAAPKDRAVARK